MEKTSARVVNINAAHETFAMRAPAGPAARAADVRIGGWLLQPTLNRVTRGDVCIRVRPQLMDILVCLASRPGEVFGRDDLVAAVWDGRWIAPSGVSRCIAELRSVFGDDMRQPRVIETIRKRGYRLIAPVESVSISDSALFPSSPAVLVTATSRRGALELDAARHSLWQWLGRVTRSLASRLPQSLAQR